MGDIIILVGAVFVMYIMASSGAEQDRWRDRLESRVTELENVVSIPDTLQTTPEDTTFDLMDVDVDSTQVME